MLDEEPTNVEQIHRVVGERMRANDKLVISVKAHKAANYNDYIRVIDQLKDANATRISIAESD